ncbi:MAG: hypothetical protein A2Y79_00960 [Deltaproteobacteria bacterium RBG_13_43_22]|nr:MAG: hypothetical protein A2Y79_00960 [Deltaproteobacteria bacterium RBG_13_43_22]
MNEDPSQAQSLKEFIDLFSDPVSSLSSLSNGTLFDPSFSSPLYLALWLEFFLIAGEKPVKERWALLPLAEQTDLGVELLKCYLFQPLYIRLSKEEKSSAIKSPLRLESQGKLFQVEHGTGTNRKIELLYPLDHLRFWPDLFQLFKEDFFSSEKVLKALEPGIILTSSSRLEKIRRRAETLGSFFRKEKDEKISMDFLSGERPKPKMVLSETSGPAYPEPPAPGPIEPSRPEPVISDLSPSPPLPPKKKRKKKPSQDQMELF